jgi:ribosomal protein S20
MDVDQIRTCVKQYLRKLKVEDKDSDSIMDWDLKSVELTLPIPEIKSPRKATIMRISQHESNVVFYTEIGDRVIGPFTFTDIDSLTTLLKTHIPSMRAAHESSDTMTLLIQMNKKLDKLLKRHQES